MNEQHGAAAKRSTGRLRLSLRGRCERGKRRYDGCNGQTEGSHGSQCGQSREPSVATDPRADHRPVMSDELRGRHDMLSESRRWRPRTRHGLLRCAACNRRRARSGCAVARSLPARRCRGVTARAASSRATKPATHPHCSAGITCSSKRSEPAHQAFSCRRSFFGSPVTC